MEALRVEDAATSGDPIEVVRGRRGNSVAERSSGGGHLGRVRLGLREAAGKIASSRGGGGVAVGNGGEVKADNVLVDPPLHPGQRLHEILLRARKRI